MYLRCREITPYIVTEKNTTHLGVMSISHINLNFSEVNKVYSDLRHQTLRRRGANYEDCKDCK